MTDTSGASAASKTPVEKDARIKSAARDALLLLDYAVASGFTTEDGRSVPDDVISIIQTTAAKLGPLDRSSKSSGDETISAAEWVGFELAYYRLASLMRPITAETLRNTEGTSDGDDSIAVQSRLWDGVLTLRNVLFGFSPAQRFTRGLWIVAIAFALFVVASEWYLVLTAHEGDQIKVIFWRSIVELLVPWAYGGLGSCVYLLKSAHVFIHQRTFDLRRKPEYFNRILLGTIAGGAIILFVNQIIGDDGGVVRLSSAALGFLAGYSTEFLFNTIERVISAILPKVGIGTVATQRPAPPPAKPVEFSELAALYGSAKTKEDREFFRSLIEQAVKKP
jgi:hypothetical protein